MDTLSHGLWGGAIFGQSSRQTWRWAFVLGMAPDLLSFGPFFATHLGDIGERWANHRFGPPDPRIIPPYVYQAYNVTHSLVIWAVLFGICYAVAAYRNAGVSDIVPTRRYTDTPLHAVWPLGAWGLHILCDIPTHSTLFFPTPYLWPFHTPFVNGVSWARGSFMLANYALLALTYLVLRLFRRRLH